MDESKAPSRREVLQAAALAASGLLPTSATADQPKQPPLPVDPLGELKLSSADLGSLFADVERLAGPTAYELSFLGDRFRRLDDWKKTARAQVFELLQHRPKKVEPR